MIGCHLGENILVHTWLGTFDHFLKYMLHSFSHAMGALLFVLWILRFLLLPCSSQKVNYVVYMLMGFSLNLWL